jgi:hypothetical protein
VLADEQDVWDTVSRHDNVDATDAGEDVDSCRSSPCQIRYAVLRVSLADRRVSFAPHKPRAAPKTPAFMAPLTRVPPHVFLFLLGGDSREPTIRSFSTYTVVSSYRYNERFTHTTTAHAQHRPTPPSR